MYGFGEYVRWKCSTCYIYWMGSPVYRFGQINKDLENRNKSRCLRLSIKKSVAIDSKDLEIEKLQSKSNDRGIDWAI